jgi:hypothetical protein
MSNANVITWAGCAVPAAVPEHVTLVEDFVDNTFRPELLIEARRPVRIGDAEPPRGDERGQ